MPDAWVNVAESRLPFVDRFDAAARARFFEHLMCFALDKRWEGAGGLQITDEMRVVIAGAAARLSMNLSLDVYDRLRSVIVYPTQYVHADREGVILGEANDFGSMVLSWDAVRGGIANPNDGHDTALHELAHVLDIEDGAFDGTPPLETSADYHAWAKAFSARYLALTRKPHKNVLRAYGATNEAEFFAVATEAFFEKPSQLEKKAPDLYAELSRYYRADPAKARS